MSKTIGWIPVLDEDFGGPDLADPSSPWMPRYEWGHTLGNERQYYTSYDKSFFTACSKGGTNHLYNGVGPATTLSLRAKHEPGSYEVWRWDKDEDGNEVFYTTCDPYDFTSGMICSKQKFLYGLFEIKCRVPFSGMKLWPAFWLWGGAPYREIDIFEFEDPSTANNMMMTLHIAEELDFGRTDNRDPSRPEPTNIYHTRVQLPDVSGFHVYAVHWRPDSVTWLVDGVPVHRVAGHSPPLEMYLIANLAIAPWRPPPDPSDLPADMEIEYIRVSRSPHPEFLYHWGNGGSGTIALWNIQHGDRLIAGDFDGDGRTEVLAVAIANWTHLIRWSGADWQFLWGNNGSNSIGLWQMKPNDRYLVGDFDGDGRDELLAVAANGWSHLMRWDGSAWHYLWGNDGDGTLAVWHLKPGDRFVVGDFDGDGRGELLAIASQGWAHMMRWDGTTWQYLWGNDGDGKLGTWNIRPQDRFIAARFDDSGKARLLAMAGQNWSHLLAWENGVWDYLWGNDGSNQIGLWNMKPTDRYVVGDFRGEGRDQIAVMSVTGWSHLMQWDGADWQYLWGNDGGETIHRWLMKPADRFVGGAFGGAEAMVLAVSQPGWAQLLKFGPVS